MAILCFESFNCLEVESNFRRQWFLAFWCDFQHVKDDDIVIDCINSGKD